MSDTLSLVQLHQFEHPRWMEDETSLLGLTLDGSLQLRVACLVQGDAGEQVIDQAHEERLVFIHLNQHITQHTVLHNGIMGGRQVEVK